MRSTAESWLRPVRSLASAASLVCKDANWSRVGNQDVSEKSPVFSRSCGLTYEEKLGRLSMAAVVGGVGVGGPAGCSAAHGIRVVASRSGKGPDKQRKRQSGGEAAGAEAVIYAWWPLLVRGPRQQPRMQRCAVVALLARNGLGPIRGQGSGPAPGVDRRGGSKGGAGGGRGGRPAGAAGAGAAGAADGERGERSDVWTAGAE